MMKVKPSSFASLAMKKYMVENYISFNPIARACLGKSIGDEVKVQTPKGINEWYIIKIEYLDGNP
jgi:transcription elongation factor GreB